MFDLDNMSGRVELSERDKYDGCGWTSTLLVSRLVNDGSLSVIFRDEGVRFYTHTHHIENEETRRAFHVVLDWNLSWQEVAHLHDFLGMLLKWEKSND
jgi:hypothetical protein